MKIGIISTLNGFSWGGSEELWASMGEEAFKEGMEVAVSISYKAAIPSKFPSLNKRITVFRRRPMLRLGRVETLLSNFASPFREIFNWKPDVICISQGTTYDCLLFADLLNLLYASGIPYIVVCQYNDEKVLRRDIRDLAKEFFERAFRIVFVSRDNMKCVERQLARNLPNAIVLQNPVNLTDVSPVPWARLWQTGMASVARLEAAFKGQDILLEILGSSQWRTREWRLELYGEGRDRKYLENLAKHYGVAERVQFCGHTDDIRSIWQANHLLVLPSRAEGTPLSLVEAMLCGRPAAVTDVGGNAEWIEDGKTGFVAEAPTKRSFGAALERAWRARPRWEVMGKQAHDNALIKFDQSAGRSLLRVVVEPVVCRIAMDKKVYVSG
jgi:L-malate glycosyltransferase